MSMLPATIAIRLEYARTQKKWLNVKRPQTFSEKVQFRKLHEAPSNFVRFADKLRCKSYIESTLGAEYVVPTLFSGTELPEQSILSCHAPFVVKPNHVSGKIKIVRNLANENWEDVRQESKRWLNHSHFSFLHEKWYDLIEPKLLVEPFLAENLFDYKFFVFHGNVHYVQVDTNRFNNHKRVFFNAAWERQEFQLKYSLETRNVSQPTHFAEMREAAERIGRDFSFVRADFYDLSDGPKLGELTFAPGSGFERFIPQRYDHILGSLWKMP